MFGKKWCNNFIWFWHYFYEQDQTCLEKVTKWYCMIEPSFKQVETCSKLVIKCFIAWLLKQVWSCLYMLNFGWFLLFVWKLDQIMCHSTMYLIKRLRKRHKVCAMWYDIWKIWVLLRLKFWDEWYIWNHCTLKQSVYLRSLKNQVNNKVWRKAY